MFIVDYTLITAQARRLARGLPRDCWSDPHHLRIERRQHRAQRMEDRLYVRLASHSTIPELTFRRHHCINHRRRYPARALRFLGALPREAARAARHCARTLVDAPAAHERHDLDARAWKARGRAHDRLPRVVQLQLVHILDPGTAGQIAI